MTQCSNAKSQPQWFVWSSSVVEAHLLVDNGQQFPLDVFAPHVFRDPLDSTAEVGTPGVLFVGVQLPFEMSHRQRACVCAGVRACVCCIYYGQ